MKLDLEGTYQELWPVVLADEYHQVWLDASAELAGEDAEAAVEKMTSSDTYRLFCYQAYEKMVQ